MTINLIQGCINYVKRYKYLKLFQNGDEDNARHIYIWHEDCVILCFNYNNKLNLKILNNNI